MGQEFSRSRTKKTKQCIFAVIATLLLIAVDQLTKHLAYQTLYRKSEKILIKGIFTLHYLENTGAAWGCFTGARVFFVAVALLFTVLVGYAFIKMPETKRFLYLRIVSVLLVAGALGNMIDRAVNGHVIDFLYFCLINFPIFNVADIYVTVGAAAFILLILFYYKDEELSFLRRHKREEQRDDVR